MPAEFHLELLTLSQLSPAIHRKPATVYADIAAKRFDRLPPIVRLPGQRKLFWRKQDVLDWIDQHVQPAVAGVVDESTSTGAKRAAQKVAESNRPQKTGRPTKRQQLERRLAAAREGK